MPDWLIVLIMAFGGGAVGGFVVYRLSRKGDT